MLAFQHFNLQSKLGCWFYSISIWNPNWGVGFPAFQFGIQIGVLVLQHFNLESKLRCCFSTISIWNPNWGVAFPPFQFGIQIGVLFFHQSKPVSTVHFGIHNNRNKQLIHNVQMYIDIVHHLCIAQYA